MRIVIDRDYDPTTHEVIGEHVVMITEETLFTHPLDADTKCSIIDVIDYLNAYPHMRDNAGWNITTQLHDEDTPKSRWQRLVEHTESHAGHPTLKSMRLTMSKSEGENT